MVFLRQDKTETQIMTSRTLWSNIFGSFVYDFKSGPLEDAFQKITKMLTSLYMLVIKAIHFLIHFSVFLQEKSYQKSWIESLSLTHVTLERKIVMKIVFDDLEAHKKLSLYKCLSYGLYCNITPRKLQFNFYFNELLIHHS